MSYKVIIIGSGSSGIAAATKLYELGQDNIVVLEAESRIGGRIHTIPFGENIVDLGAQRCHVRKGNAIYDLATKYQYDVFDSSLENLNNFSLIKSNRDVVPEEIRKKLTNLISSFYEDENMYHSKGSVGEYLTKKFNEAIQDPKYSDIDINTREQFIKLFLKRQFADDACDSLFNISVKNLYNYFKDSCSINWNSKGHITILRILMKSTEDNHFGILQNKILLNKKVKEINWIPNDDGKITVKCVSGEKFFADHVICTVSLGVLKNQYSTMFDPSLPTLKVRAIEGWGFGNADKLFIEFEKPFWPENWPGFCLLWNENDLKEIRNCKDKWLEDIYGFYNVDYQPNILCGWIVGAKCKEMEANSDEDVLNGLIFLLEKFLPWKIPKPKNFKRSSWHLNPNFCGSHSYHSIRADELNVKPTDLAYPLTVNEKPVLLFAGEATNKQHYSTVHGAIETGWREANRLYDYYFKLKDNHLKIKKSISSNGKIEMNKFNNAQTKNSTKRIYDVIILGCGLAGLGAGLCLKQNNEQKNSKKLKFTILEAQDYIGGRVRTVQMYPTNKNDQYLTQKLSDICDSGAQWLHGERNKLYKIAQEFNLLTKELSEEGLGSYICDNGEIIDDFIRKKIDFKIGQILEECEKFIKHKEFPKSVGEYLKEKFYEYIENNIKLHFCNGNSPTTDPDSSLDEITKATTKNNKYRDIALRLLDWHERFQIIDNSCKMLEELSAKFWGLYSYNGESCQAHINFKNGFSTIIDVLCQKINDHNDLNDEEEDYETNLIQMQSEACDIHWNIDKDDNHNLILIKTRDSRNFYARHLIVTIPIGVLKEIEHKLFVPKLPVRIRNAINCIGFETINKIFLQFDNEWWQPMEGIQLLFNNEDKCDENSHWTRYMTGFDILHPGSPNTLVGWVGSYGAIKMEQLTNNQIMEDCIELLRKFTKRKVPFPIRFYCSRWNTNEFIRGGYSFLSTKCEKSNITGRTLSIPVTLSDLKCKNHFSNGIMKKEDCIDKLEENEIDFINHDDSINNYHHKNDYPLIYFAGEACHDKYFSTAHGAFESGFDQAQKLLKFYSM